jgi:hypothetical protein
VTLTVPAMHPGAYLKSASGAVGEPMVGLYTRRPRPSWGVEVESDGVGRLEGDPTELQVDSDGVGDGILQGEQSSSGPGACLATAVGERAVSRAA